MLSFMLISAACIAFDVLIIITSYNKVDTPDDTDYVWVHKIFYLEILAFIRLVLLLPLFVNSVTGKRLEYPKTMSFMLYSTIGAAFVHMFAILLIEPESVHDITLDTDDEEKDLGMVWTALLLTVSSCFLHRIGIRSLSSTAPPVRGTYVTKAGSKHASQRLAYHYRKILYGDSSLASQPMQASTNTDFFASIETNSLHSQESTVAEAVGMFPPFFDHSADEAAGGGMMITEHQAANNDTDVAEIEVPLLPPRTVSRTNSVASSLENTTLDGTFEINAPNISILQRLKERLNHINTHQSDSSFGCFPGEGDDNRNEFLSELIARVEDARRRWTSKFNDVTTALHLPVNLGSDSDRRLTTFKLLLDLFMYEGNPIPELETPWTLPGDPKAQQELIFYTPQLSTFLIYGAFLNSRELEAFLLDKCTKNLRFAHSLYWFLLAWSLELSHSGLNSPSRSNVRRPLRSYDSEGDILNTPSRRKRHRRVNSNGAEKTKKFLKEDYRMIISLAHRVQACGEMAARKLLERQKAISLEFAIPQYVKQNAGNYTPINEGFPNGAHLETILAERTVGVWNEDKVKTIFEDQGQTSPVRYFNVAPAFFDELTKIADDLLFVDVNRRTESLRTKLNVLESQYLPSNLIYVPFFSREHVVWRIVSKESFAISTKERVPCFVTLECVNISEDDEDTDELLNWYKTPRHPQRFNTIFQIINQKGRAALKGVIKLRHSTSGLDLAVDNHGIVEDQERERGKEDVESQNSGDIGQWAVPSTPNPGLVRRHTEMISDASTGTYGSNGRSSSPLIDAPRTVQRSRPPRSQIQHQGKPAVIFKEKWSEKEIRIRSESCYGNHPGWHLLPVFVKSNDDLRQEQLASQLIRQMAVILSKAKIPVWLYPYQIVALSDRGGIIEAVPNTISISSLKKNHPNWIDLPTFFNEHFSDHRDHLAGAQANFVESIAAYSIVCYLLQIKDRHNGNILLSSSGHLVHIDFGFFFLSSPGKNTGFESAPFKLTSEYVSVMGGPSSKMFARFRNLCVKTFMALRKHCHQITLLVDMLSAGNEELQCFRGRPDKAISELRDRFMLELNDHACKEYVNGLINESIQNWRTTCYDRYQYCCVGVL